MTLLYAVLLLVVLRKKCFARTAGSCAFLLGNKMIVGFQLIPIATIFLIIEYQVVTKKTHTTTKCI